MQPPHVGPPTKLARSGGSPAGQPSGGRSSLVHEEHPLIIATLRLGISLCGAATQACPHSSQFQPAHMLAHHAHLSKLEHTPARTHTRTHTLTHTVRHTVTHPCARTASPGLSSHAPACRKNPGPHEPPACPPAWESAAATTFSSKRGSPSLSDCRSEFDESRQRVPYISVKRGWLEREPELEGASI